MRAALEEEAARGRRRELRLRSGLDFSSNDYLGLAERWSRTPLEVPLHGSTGSRLLSGQSEAWRRCEERLSDWHGCGRRALYFSSGYLAGEGLLATLLQEDSWVASDASNHGSLIDGMRLGKAERFIYPHQDLEALEDGLSKAPRGKRRFVVTESLFGMDGDLTDLPALVSICEHHDALLILDEAHATGCYGPGGKGLAAEAGVSEKIFASIHTCGKAFASHGAYVLVPDILRETLIQRCRQFLFTTALPPALALCTERALEVFEKEPELRSRLAEASGFLRAELEAAGFEAGPAGHIFILRLGSSRTAQAWMEGLEQKGFHVPAIRYPTTPENGARLRISVRADHPREALADLVRALVEIREGR